VQQLYYIGVDGGGTKTTAILFDTVTGEVRLSCLGGGNICVLGKTGCIEIFKELTNQLLSNAPANQIAYSTFAFAGAGRLAERSILESVVKECGFKQFSILTDAELSHYSFFGDSLGILIASGTGSVCLVNPENGKYHQIGGWGYILNDSGSGFHIGKLAISHAMEIHDSGFQVTKLTEFLLDFYRVSNPTELISQTYMAKSPQTFVASCAEQVDKLAKEGEPTAVKIISTAAESLVDLAKKAMAYCEKTNTDTFKIAMAGSVLNADSQMSQRFRENMSKYAPNAEYCTQQWAPAVGAVLHSAARDGHALSEQNKQQLLKKLPDNKK